MEEMNEPRLALWPIDGDVVLGSLDLDRQYHIISDKTRIDVLSDKTGHARTRPGPPARSRKFLPLAAET